jgi:hypothetical protein
MKTQSDYVPILPDIEARKLLMDSEEKIVDVSNAGSDVKEEEETSAIGLAPGERAEGGEHTS